MPKPLTKKATIHMTEDDYAKAEALADQDRRTVTQYLSIIMEDAIDAIPDPDELEGKVEVSRVS